MRADAPGLLLAFPLSAIAGLLESDAVIAAELTSAALQRASQRMKQFVIALVRYCRAYGPLPPDENE